MPSLVSELAPSWLPTCCASGQTARRIESAPGGPDAFARSNWTFWPSNGTTVTGCLLAKLDYFHRCLRDGSQRCLIAVRYLLPERPPLASIMLPRVPGSANAFILPFAPTEAYADEKDPFRVLVLSRTMFGVVVVDVANKNTPIAGGQSRSHRAMPQASSSPPLPMTKARPFLRSRRFRKVRGRGNTP